MIRKIRAATRLDGSGYTAAEPPMGAPQGYEPAPEPARSTADTPPRLSFAWTGRVEGAGAHGLSNGVLPV